MQPQAGGVYIYTRVSTASQGGLAEGGYGITAQANQCGLYAQLYSLQVLAHTSEVASAKAIKGRPVLQGVLAQLQPGQGLIVSKLDRLTRSIKDLLTLVELSQQGGWRLISVADNLDTASANGRLVLHILGSVAEWERAVISERTKAGLTVARAAGKRLGRPPRKTY